MKKPLSTALVLFCVFLLAGCANTIRTYDDTEDRIERATIGTKYAVLLNPEMPNSFEFTATAATVHKQKVKKYQTFIHGEVVTPYQGWREFYEVPCGLVLVPVSLCSHLISVFTFGVYPFSFSNDVTCVAYTGLNPCLNWESDSRTEKRPIESEDKLIDETEEDKVTPIPEAMLKVATSDLTREFKTDEFGTVKLTLVGLDRGESIFRGDREFHFTVSGDTEITHRLLISREFANKLLRARAAIMRYETAPTGRKLAETVKTLEELKFTGLAFQLEKRELARNQDNTAFMDEFNNMALE